MNDAADSPESLGKRLLDAGWRQCSLVKPDPAHLGLIPVHLEFEPSRERLMLVTQSCSICGESRNNERFVEAMIVEMLPKLLPDHGQSRKGAMVRELVVPVSGSPGYEGLRCDIDRRCFVSRTSLLGWSRDEAVVETAHLLAFQGWMARYYARVAVPTELVSRLERAGFHKAMKKVLEKRFTEDGSGPRVHEVIDRIYIKWKPDDELPDDADYEVWLIIACKDEGRVEAVDERILALPFFSGGKVSREGASMDEPAVKWVGNIVLGSIEGYTRLGSWDALTGLEDHASAARSE